MSLDNFVLLDERLESCLHRLREETKDGSLSNVSISERTYNSKEISELRRCNCIDIMDTSTLSGSSWLVTLTYNGQHYQELKKQYLRILRKPTRAEWIRYSVTTLISVAAIIISIISLCQGG